MALVMQQDQLFVLKGSKGRDVKRSMGIHQQDLVTGQGRGLTKRRQGIVTTWTKWDVGLVMEQQREFFLNFPSLANGVVFRVLVQASFGGDEGSSTTELVVVGNPDDRFGVPG